MPIHKCLKPRRDLVASSHRYPRMTRLFRFVTAAGLLACMLFLNGCWATWSELKKERRLRETLEEQFRAFKREQRVARKKQVQEQTKTLAKQAALVAQLRVNIQRFQTKIERIDKRVNQGQGGVVEMFATLEKLQRSFQSSLGQVQELQKQIQELLQRLPERDKSLQEIRKKYEDLLKNQQQLAEQAIPAKLFARAEEALKRKDFANAMRLFKTFTQRFGSHDLADNAYLHIGDVHRKEGRRNDAILSYLDVIQKTPQGNAVPVALLWLGRLHYLKGECQTGRKYFRRLMNYRRHAPALARAARNFNTNWRQKCVGARRTRTRRRRTRRRTRRRRR